MQRFLMIAALAALSAGWLVNGANAQTVIYTNRPYLPPIIVVPPPTQAYYVVPQSTSYYVTPATVTYSSSYSYYPPVVTQSVVAYSAPTVVVMPRPTVYETRTYYSFGVLRPRGYHTEVRAYP